MSLLRAASFFISSVLVCALSFTGCGNEFSLEEGEGGAADLAGAAGHAASAGETPAGVTGAGAGSVDGGSANVGEGGNPTTSAGGKPDDSGGAAGSDGSAYRQAVLASRPFVYWRMGVVKD